MVSVKHFCSIWQVVRQVGEDLTSLGSAFECYGVGEIFLFHLAGCQTSWWRSDICWLCLSVLWCRWNTFVPSGRSSDKSVKIWDAGSRQCVHTFYEHMDQVSTLCLTVPQSATVAAEIKVPSAISVSAKRIPPPPPQPPKCCQVFSLKSVVAKKRAPLSALLSHDGLQWMQKLRDPLHPPPSPILCLYFSVNSHPCMLVLTVTYVCLLTIACELRSPWHPPFPHVCISLLTNTCVC